MLNIARMALIGLATIARLTATAPFDTISAGDLVEPSNGTSEIDKRGIELTCYDSCSGITRQHAADAADWFCSLYAGQPIGTGLFGNYLYKPTSSVNDISPHFAEQGNISMSIVAATGTPGAWCFPSKVAPYKNCVNGMIAPIDDCNKNTVKAKQGGWYISGCLTVTVNPNPSPCPYIGS